MKKTACWLLILSMLLLLALPAGAAEKTPAFADAGDIRNGYAVRMLVDLGLIVGDNDGNFRPSAPITRAETAKLIACLCTDTFAQAGGAPFADTAESWARDYIAYCASRGIVGGSGGYFRPQDDVTARADLSAYSDAGQIPSWAMDAMQWANARQLIIGRDSAHLAPTAATTRAEMASILSAYIGK